MKKIQKLHQKLRRRIGSMTAFITEKFWMILIKLKKKLNKTKRTHTTQIPYQHALHHSMSLFGFIRGSEDP